MKKQNTKKMKRRKMFETMLQIFCKFKDVVGSKIVNIVVEEKLEHCLL